VSEQRERFIEDYPMNYYFVTKPGKRFNSSRNTALLPPRSPAPWLLSTPATQHPCSSSFPLASDAPIIVQSNCVIRHLTAQL